MGAGLAVRGLETGFGDLGCGSDFMGSGIELTTYDLAMGLHNASGNEQAQGSKCGGGGAGAYYMQTMRTSHRKRIISPLRCSHALLRGTGASPVHLCLLHIPPPFEHPYATVHCHILCTSCEGGGGVLVCNPPPSNPPSGF